MTKTLGVRIKHKIDSEANWTSKNPVLLKGELVFSITTEGVKQKIGDGTTRYASLPFTDELLRTFISGNYVTKTELNNAIATLEAAIEAAKGFASTEADM